LAFRLLLGTRVYLCVLMLCHCFPLISVHLEAISRYSGTNPNHVLKQPALIPDTFIVGKQMVSLLTNYLNKLVDEWNIQFQLPTYIRYRMDVLQTSRRAQIIRNLSGCEGYNVLLYLLCNNESKIIWIQPHIPFHAQRKVVYLKGGCKMIDITRWRHCL